MIQVVRYGEVPLDLTVNSHVGNWASERAICKGRVQIANQKCIRN